MKNGILISDRERAQALERRRAHRSGVSQGTETPADGADGAGREYRVWTRRRRRMVASLTGWSFAAPATLIILGLTLFPAGWAFLISREHWNGFTPPRQIGWEDRKSVV